MVIRFCAGPDCRQALRDTQPKYCSRACAGRGIPAETRREAGRVGGTTRMATHWQRFLEATAGEALLARIQAAYRWGYRNGKQHRERGSKVTHLDGPVVWPTCRLCQRAMVGAPRSRKRHAACVANLRRVKDRARARKSAQDISAAEIERIQAAELRRLRARPIDVRMSEGIARATTGRGDWQRMVEGA